MSDRILSTHSVIHNLEKDLILPIVLDLNILSLDTLVSQGVFNA
jgi:hypothetical protein